MRSRLLAASALVAGLAAGTLTGCSPAAPGTGSSPGAPPPPSSVSEDALAPRIAATLDVLVDAGATAAVIDVRSGAERMSGAAGVRAVDDPDPAEADDPLRIASVTKTMTATLVLQLVEAGQLSLETTIDELAPGLIDAPGPVTVRQLLAHTSGMPDYFGVLVPDTGSYLATTDRVFTAEELIAAAQTLPWVAPPGERFAYANTNYVVLGRILETVTGEALPALFESRIFEPLGMDASEFPVSPGLPDDALRGATGVGGESIDTGDASPTLWNAGAAVTSTVGDVSTFFQGLFGGDLVSPESVSAMQQVGVEGYGLGILAGGDACGAQPVELVYGQRGNGVGYRVMSFASPDGERVVTIGWTGGTFDPATDPLIVPGNAALVEGLAETCP